MIWAINSSSSCERKIGGIIACRKSLHRIAAAGLVEVINNVVSFSLGTIATLAMLYVVTGADGDTASGEGGVVVLFLFTPILGADRQPVSIPCFDQFLIYGLGLY